MDVWRDVCYCNPGPRVCSTVECNRHIVHVYRYQKAVDLYDQLPVAFADFSVGDCPSFVEVLDAVVTRQGIQPLTPESTNE